MMYNLQILFSAVLPFIWSVSALPGRLVARDQKSGITTTIHTPSRKQSPSPNTEAAHVLTITQRAAAGTISSAGYTKDLTKNGQVNGVYGTSAVMNNVDQGLVFTTEIGVGNQNYTVVVDTGMSDTWLVEDIVVCDKGKGACKFGPAYKQSSTFQSLDETFDFPYNDGEYLFGPFGTDEVTVAGIIVKDQQIALVQSANWAGDGVTSGSLGLGPPGNTRAFSGHSQIDDTADKVTHYSPFFTSATTEGSVAPLFSLALSRDATGGMLAIGGLPPVAYVPTFASSPFQLLTASSTSTAVGTTPDYTFYVITTNGFEYQSAQSNWNVGSWLTYFGNPNDASQIQVLIDSATSVNYIPQATADRVNALFEPAATYNEKIGGYYVVECNAKAPEFGVKIGQEIFYVNPVDNILDVGSYANGDKLCITGITRTGAGGNSVLGNVFLRNVLAVFDVGASEMRFAARVYS